MRWLEISSSPPLKGSIRIPGSKNSSLGLLAACCLADSPVTLINIPDILDIKVVCDIGKEIGLTVRKEQDALIVDPAGIHSAEIDPVKSSTFRTAYYFVGALLARHKKVSVGFPGGDRIGPRPIDQHIKGLEALGARFTFYKDHYVVEAEKLTGCEIYFDMITFGATVNVMLAAVLARGKTILRNAARDPEVVDIAILLNKMGAKIYGAGTDTIRILGVDCLHGCSHTVIPDRLIAGAFLITAGVTGGEITVEDVIPEHLEICAAKLSQTGVHIEKSDTAVTARGQEYVKAVRVRTGMYPEFVSDYQQPFTTLLLRASGRSTITEKVFPERFHHCLQLKRMGAAIDVKRGIATIQGPCSLKGGWVHATDIRAGICLILAGLIAEGTTYITGIEHIERGYTDATEAFRSLGANIRLCESSGNEILDASGNVVCRMI